LPDEARTPDEPNLGAGTLLGPYRIVRVLGTGGFGAVYLAEDTRLGRTVAIKVLRNEAARSDSTRQRFEREARAISSLNHPHICALHDVGTYAGAEYLVMEHVVGETLAARLRKGALPFPSAVMIASQVAAALGAAHAKGIVHRDLKPENIMLTEGGAKVLDFGLAVSAPACVAAEGDSTATQTQALTTEGSIAGTLAYMAPEQIEGRPCDARTDIFAFGLVLYEMVTGKRAFSQATKAGLIAAVVASQPDFSPLPHEANETFRRVLRGCLEKEPLKRWQSIVDVQRLLEWTHDTTPGTPQGSRVRNWIPWMAAAAAVISAVLMAFSSGRRPEEQSLRFRVTLESFDGFADAAGALSPDGSQIAFVSRTAAGATQLSVHRLDNLEPLLRLEGTEGAANPFWSPDGRWIGYYADGKLNRIRPSGGAPQKIADIPHLGQAAWGAAGDIVFSGGSRTPLFHIRTSGGTPRQITTLDLNRMENSHRFPVFLPGGKLPIHGALRQQREQRTLYSLAGWRYSGSSRRGPV
jgi:serine/threonine protein kinase